MLLFKPYHVQPILSGQKTQTRRAWKRCRVRVGAVHQCRTQMLDKSSTFARVKILKVWRERIDQISRADALAEGYGSKDDFLERFCEINPAVPLYARVWAVSFSLYAAESAGEGG